MIAGFQYTRDAVGNPTGVSLADGNAITYTYDDNYRLTREARSGTGACLRQAQADRTYTFDAVGNRTTKQSGGTTTTYTYNAADRLVVENAGGALTSYAWDAAGNNTVINTGVGPTMNYAWDAENRLWRAVTGGSVIATFTYSPRGLRTSREDSGGLTRFLWDGQTLLEELDSGGSPTARYASAPGAYGPIVSQRRWAVSHFLHGTDLGTIEALTDASGDVTDTYVNTAFGVATASSGSTPNPHRFIGALGYYTDPLGPLYVRARWLRPGTGSWLSSDPVLSEPRYQYVGGRAAWAVDPRGDAQLRDTLRKTQQVVNSLWKNGDKLRPPAGDPPVLPPTNEENAETKVLENLEKVGHHIIEGGEHVRTEAPHKGAHVGHPDPHPPWISGPGYGHGHTGTGGPVTPVISPGGGGYPPVVPPGGGGGFPPVGPPTGPGGGAGCEQYPLNSNERLLCEGCLAIVGGLVCNNLGSIWGQLVCGRTVQAACAAAAMPFELYECASAESCAEFGGDPIEGPDCCERKCGPCLGTGGMQTDEYLHCWTAGNRGL